MKNLLWQTGLVCLVQILSHAAAFGTLHDDIRAPRTAHKRNRTSDSSSLSAAVSADDLSPRALTHWSVDSNFRANLKNRKRQFIVVRNAQLEYQDGTPFRFASFNAPELLEGGIDHFEVEDTFRTLDGLARCVTRTYTLAVKGTPLLWFGPHILGWDKRRNDWIYNETMFQRVRTNKGPWWISPTG